MLEDVKASPLLVAPKTWEPTFATSIIGADTGGGTGGGTDPLKGEDAKRATRFYGQFARNAKDSTPAGSLQWCAARPQQFDAICGNSTESEGDTVYFTGMVEAVKVRAFGFGYPHPPTKASDFTTSISQMPWARS